MLPSLNNVETSADHCEPGIGLESQTESIGHGPIPMNAPASFDVIEHAAKFCLSRDAIKYIRQCMAGPSLQPNGFRSTTVRLPSTLTKMVLTLHSRGWELPLALMVQYDPDACYMLEQPAGLKLSYFENGKLHTPLYRPDLLVFWNNRPPTVFEARPLKTLSAHCLREPGRYQEIGFANIRSIPAEEAFKTLGFEFRIVHEKHFVPQFLKNVWALRAYFEHELAQPPSDEELNSILNQVRATPGIVLDSVQFPDRGRRADLIYRMIARSILFTDLSETPIADQNRLPLFPDLLRQRAFLTFNHRTAFKAIPESALPYELSPGLQIKVEKGEYTIEKLDSEHVFLVNRKGSKSKLTIGAFLELSPKIDSLLPLKLSFEAQVRSLSDRDLNEFLRRYSDVLPYLPGGELAGQSPKNRNTRRWLKNYRRAEERGEIGLSALLPKHRNKGRRRGQVATEVDAVIERFINKFYLRGNPRLPKIKVYYRIRRALRLMGVTNRLNYSTVSRRCNRIDKYRRELARNGVKMAEEYRPPFPGLSPMGSPNGNRSWMVAHLDHTQRDLALDHPEKSRRLEKHWHSVLVDAFDRRVLAWVNSPKHPSVDTLIELFRTCVARHQTLPLIIVCDWGSDFRSTWFETTLGLLHIAIFKRVKSKGREGAPVEAMFAAGDRRYIHTLTGSTELLKQARKVTAKLDPRKHALWTLRDVEEQDLIYYDTYNNAPLQEFKCSPNERARELAAYLGNHSQRCLNEVILDRTLLPLVDGFTRKVSPMGTVFFNRERYTDSRLSDVREEEVYVRYRPGDPRRVFVSHAKLDGLVECTPVRDRLKYCEDASEAVTISFNTNKIDPQLAEKSHEAWSDFDEGVEKREAEMHKRRRRKKRGKPAVEEPEGDNIIVLEHTAGGMVQIADPEGGK